MKKVYLHSVAVLLFLMMTSCISDWPGILPGSGENTDDESEILLRINTPSGFSAAGGSRSLTLEEESKIENIWVLAFNATGNITEIRKGENLQDIGNSTRSFTATLKRSTSSTDTYNLMVLANAESIISRIGTNVENIQDKSYAAIVALLYESIFSKMYASTGTIPMWGESGQLEIKPGTNNQISLSMLRSVARIDVGVGAPTLTADGTYKWNGKDSKDASIPFELKEVYVVSPNNMYSAAPNIANITNNKATAPSVPQTAAKFTIDESVANFKYSDPEITASTADFGSYTTQSIYIPEADVKITDDAMAGDANHENRMAIVVGGDYNNSGTITYYRLDLANNGNIINALRNHLYQFNISQVSGYGYTDVATAYRSLSLNMKVDVLDWDESDMNDVYFDGQNYFSITKNKVEFSPMGKEVENVTIKTNVKNLEFWEERDGDEHLEIQLGGTTTYTNDDMGYVYTLTTVSDGVYNLKIEATKHNVSNTVSNRLDKWRIKANRLNAKFEVDQQYTVLYVSYVNGQSQNLYPEGTLANFINIEIMALKPVDIKAEAGGALADWIELGDISGLTQSDNGLYQARLKINVKPFKYEANAPTLRTGTITVTPQGENPRVFTINQESPVFKFAKTSEIVTRKGNSTYHTYVDIITNLPDTDFKIVEAGSNGDGASRITHKDFFYNVDKTNPRSRRFDVDVDMVTNLPMQTPAFYKSFKAEVNSDYGPITIPEVKFEVLEGDSHFDWFWESAIIPPASIDYDFVEGDNSMLYIFPWQTLSTTIHFNSNNGLEYYSSHVNNKPLNGILIKGTGITTSDYIATPYTFTFNKANNNNADYYDLYFKSNTSATTLVKNWKMGLGVQVWTRTPSTTTLNINYKGYPEATPYEIDVKSNVEWDATATTTPVDANFVKMRPKATEQWIAPPMEVDDRIIVPVEAATYNTGTHLVQTNKMGIAIEPYNTLNATPSPRTVEVKFTNKSINAGGSGGGGASIANSTLKFTQYAPTLKYYSGAPSSTIEYFGASYTIYATTNIQSWGVRVYEGNDNTGTILIDRAYGTSGISDVAPANRGVNITIPRYNNTTDRNLTFYLYHKDDGVAEKEVKIRTVTQSWVDYININGVKWKRGNLVASNSYSGNYSYSCTVGSPNDAGLYFKYGSLLGWRGGSNGDGTGIGSPSKYVWARPSSYSGSTTWSNVRFYDNGGFLNDAAAGMGDPCAYYLGDRWRTPTKSEYESLSYSSFSSYGSINGVYAGPYHNVTNGIFFPASGRRTQDLNGGLEWVYNDVVYISRTHYTANNNWGLWVSSHTSDYTHNWWRANATPVRCIAY